MKKTICLFGIVAGIVCTTLRGCSTSVNNNEESDSKVSTELSSTDNVYLNDYYKENAEVVSVIKAKESSNVLSGQEVTKLLSDRGFDTENVVADYTMDGDYLNESVINENDTEKHPLYKMLYNSKTEILWNIYIINGAIYAYPVSYNLVSERDAVLIITENDTVTSYDYNTNQFYETIPKESVIIVKKVNKINKKTLDTLTIEGLSELWKSLYL